MPGYKTLNSPYQLASTITAFPSPGTDYLGFRDLPLLLEKYVLGKEALDVGCGTGRSARFLKSLGYQVIGIDIFEPMLTEAKELDPLGDYRVISSQGEWPIGNKKFDLILFSFVLIELASKEEIKKVLEKAKQCLTEQGVAVILTTSEEAYKNDWLSMAANFPENEKARSGDIVKLYVKEHDFELKDYYWKDKDYSECIHHAGLQLLEKYYPLGNKMDNKAWISEEKISPFVIYLLNVGLTESNDVY